MTGLTAAPASLDGCTRVDRAVVLALTNGASIWAGRPNPTRVRPRCVGRTRRESIRSVDVAPVEGAAPPLGRIFVGLVLRRRLDVRMLL